MEIRERPGILDLLRSATAHTSRLQVTSHHPMATLVKNEQDPASTCKEDRQA